MDPELTPTSPSSPASVTPYCLPHIMLGLAPNSHMQVKTTDYKGGQGISWGWARRWACLVRLGESHLHPMVAILLHDEFPISVPEQWEQLLNKPSGRCLKATCLLSCRLSLETSPSCWKWSYSRDPRLHTGERANLQSIFEILGQLLTYSTGYDKWVSV